MLTVFDVRSVLDGVARLFWKPYTVMKKTFFIHVTYIVLEEIGYVLAVFLILVFYIAGILEVEMGLI